jgi:hypothetical protein
LSAARSAVHVARCMLHVASCTLHASLCALHAARLLVLTHCRLVLAGGGGFAAFCLRAALARAALHSGNWAPTVVTVPQCSS